MWLDKGWVCGPGQVLPPLNDLFLNTSFIQNFLYFTVWLATWEVLCFWLEIYIVVPSVCKSKLLNRNLYVLFVRMIYTQLDWTCVKEFLRFVNPNCRTDTSVWLMRIKSDSHCWIKHVQNNWLTLIWFWESTIVKKCQSCMNVSQC